MEDSNDEKISS